MEKTMTHIEKLEASLRESFREKLETLLREEIKDFTAFTISENPNTCKPHVFFKSEYMRQVNDVVQKILTENFATYSYL
jgi:hypothetical protein